MLSKRATALLWDARRLISELRPSSCIVIRGVIATIATMPKASVIMFALLPPFIATPVSYTHLKSHILNRLKGGCCIAAELIGKHVIEEATVQKCDYKHACRAEIYAFDGYSAENVSESRDSEYGKHQEGNRFYC